MPTVFHHHRILFAYLTSALGSVAQEDFEPERGEPYPVVTLLEILIILVGILAGFVLLKNRQKK